MFNEIRIRRQITLSQGVLKLPSSSCVTPFTINYSTKLTDDKTNNPLEAVRFLVINKRK